LYTLHEATLQHYGFVIFNQCRKRIFLGLKIRIVLYPYAEKDAAMWIR